MSNAAVILAAGKGTRMRSDLPKVLHEIDGRPMVSYVIDVIGPLCAEGVYVVVGYQAERVIAALEGEHDSAVQFVLQKEQLGTGHAVMQCETALAGVDGTIIVLNGDVPGLRRSTVEAFLSAHRSSGAAATVLTAELEDPTGYGRIVRDTEGNLSAIVEQKDADAKTRAIREINTGLFCFVKDKLFAALSGIGRGNAQQEYYLTDVIEILRRRGETVRAYCVDDAREVAGINTVEELEAARDFMGR